MSNRKKQRMIIGVLSVILIVMAVGYGAMNQLLKISGTSGIANNFNVQITKIEENTMKDATTITTSGIGTTEANFTVDLKKPGSSAIYNITVENKGNIEAMVSNISELDESNSEAPLDITYSIDGIKVGDFIEMKESMTFQVKVEWDINATTIPTTTKSLTLKLDYEQYIGPTPTDGSCFTINERGTITGYTCTDTDVVIPRTINGTKVKSIGTESMRGKNLTSVVIQKGVTSIEYGAFASNQLTSVEIPDSVTNIGSNAFRDNQLTSVTFGKGLSSIASYAFYNNQLASVEIPNSVTSLGYGAFWSNQLTSVTLGNSVEVIGNYAFYGNQLTSIDIPNSVESIGESAFQSNQLTSVEIPNSVTSIGVYAFSDNKLTSVTIPRNVTNIESFAFRVNSNRYSNPNLTKIVNKTGRPFNWYDITEQGSSSEAITGTYGQVVVTSE